MKNNKKTSRLRKLWRNLTYRFSKDYRLDKKVSKFLKGRNTVTFLYNMRDKEKSQVWNFKCNKVYDTI